MVMLMLEVVGVLKNRPLIWATEGAPLTVITEPANAATSDARSLAKARLELSVVARPSMRVIRSDRTARWYCSGVTPAMGLSRVTATLPELGYVG